MDEFIQLYFSQDFNNQPILDMIKEKIKSKTLDVNYIFAGDLNTLLHYVSHAGCPKCVELLLANGANVAAQNGDGEIALHHAMNSKALTLEEYYGTIELLLGAGSNINKENNFGGTPIFGVSPRFIQRKYYVEIYEYLISKGADYKITDNRGRSFINYQATKKEILFFINKGIDITCVDNDGKNILMHTDDPKMINFLLSTGLFDINLKDNIGWSTLHWAVYKVFPNLKLIRTLVQNGADIGSQTVDGYTPLHITLMAGSKSGAKCLLNLGASPNVLSKKGLTPLEEMDAMTGNEILWSDLDAWEKYKIEMHKLLSKLDTVR
jgi:ankyrin repeat protein